MAELTPELQTKRESLVKAFRHAKQTIQYNMDSYTHSEVQFAHAEVAEAERALKEFDKHHTAVRVEVRSEVGTSNEPAKVLIYENERLVAEVVAIIELKRGTDGGWYHCVTLKKQ